MAAEKAALDAYAGMWRAYAEAGLTADAGAPELTKFATGRALQTLRDGLASYKAKGQVIKGRYGSEPRVARLSPVSGPRSATIIDCLDGTEFLVYKLSGELADDEPGGRRSTTATVDNVGGGTWKVSGFAVREVGTC